MQKDVHFYLTYLLAVKAGLPRNKAKLVAWADQHTDDLTEAELHGIQTQSAILGNWHQRQVQLSVLVPFHFIPGAAPDHPWVTAPDSDFARALVSGASENLFQLGIALHGHQDTFSHQGFSGWQEEINACFPWYFIESALPNVGHAEMRVIPDVVSYVWTDPRNGERIDNKKRAMSAAKTTFDFLCDYFNPDIDKSVWRQLKPELREAFKIESYDDRKQRLKDLAENQTIRCSKLTAGYQKKYGDEFISAARCHLALAMELFKDLPAGGPL